MSLLVCDRCKCVDNTSLNGSSMEDDLAGINLCSECKTGTWHGEFAKRKATEAERIMADQLEGYEHGKFTFHPLWNIYAQDKENFDIEALKKYEIKKGGTIQYHVENVFNNQNYWRGSAIHPQVRITPKIGRNDPCPCGSGRKYKKCCGSPIAKGE